MSANLLETPVADLVIEHPGRARIFERLDIDYCCGGDHSLADACGKKDLNPEKVAELLESETDGPAHERQTDWTEAPLGDLIDHIVSTHHEYLRRELPRLDPLLTRVTQAHGAQVSWLDPLLEVFQTMKNDLYDHMESEESRVFPAIRAIIAGPSEDEELDSVGIDKMIEEHEDTGAALRSLRDLSNGFTPPETACPKFRAALHGLEELDRDLRRHMHKENNILFPRARSTA